MNSTKRRAIAHLFLLKLQDLHRCSGMPFYNESVMNESDEGSMLELKLPDRRIVFFCPSRNGDRKDGLWYFNIEFPSDNGEVLTLPGQVMVNSDEVYRKTVCGKLPFVEILEQIKLTLSTGNADAAVPV